MAITYEHFLVNGTDAYSNRKDGTSNIRVRKLSDGVEVLGTVVDVNIPTAELEGSSTRVIQDLIDKLIAEDMARDAADVIEDAKVIPPINNSTNNKIKATKTPSKNRE